MKPKMRIFYGKNKNLILGSHQHHDKTELVLHYLLFMEDTVKSMKHSPR